jgi:hypothetical protein
MSYLRGLVLTRLRSFPTIKEAADFFEVSEALAKQWDSGSKPVSLAAVEKVFSVDSVPGVRETEVAMWEGRQVCIMMPSYKTSNPRTAFCLLNLFDRAKTAAMLDFGDAMIAHSRCKLGDRFLKSNIEWALTLDDDMVFPFGNAPLYNQFCRSSMPESFAGLHTVNRLLSHGKTLVGALYQGRWEHGKPVYAEAYHNKEEEAYARKAPYDLIKPTRWVGTGCMLIHRSVFLDIEKKFPHLARNKDGDYGHWFSPSEHDLKEATAKTLDVLDDVSISEKARLAKARELMARGKALSEAHSGLGVGEDVVFCNRAAQAGHQPYVDMGLVCGHVGEHVFSPAKK